MSPLLESNYLDPCDVFLLGHVIGKTSAQFLRVILDVVKQLVVLKRCYEVAREKLDLIYCLILESEWQEVLLRLAK